MSLETEYVIREMTFEMIEEGSTIREVMERLEITDQMARTYYWDAKVRKYWGRNNPKNADVKRDWKAFYKKDLLDQIEQMDKEGIPGCQICHKLTLTRYHLIQARKKIVERSQTPN